MSLNDPLFDGMSHRDGSARRPGMCVCGQETSDEDEALCRMCLQDESQAAFQPGSPVTSEQTHDAGVRLVAAAAASPHPRAVTTPTAMAELHCTGESQHGQASFSGHQVLLVLSYMSS